MRLGSSRSRCDQAAPFIIQLQQQVCSAQVRIAICQAPLVFTREVEIINPLMSLEELAAFRIKMQNRTASVADTDVMLVAFDGWTEFM